jgi:hypothetical protein
MLILHLTNYNIAKIMKTSTLPRRKFKYPDDMDMSSEQSKAQGVNPRNGRFLKTESLYEGCRV